MYLRFIIVFIIVYFFISFYNCRRDISYTYLVNEKEEEGESVDNPIFTGIIFSKVDEFKLNKVSPNSNKISNNKGNFVKNRYFYNMDGNLNYITGYWDGLGAGNKEYALLEFSLKNNGNISKGDIIEYQKIKGASDWMKLESQNSIYKNRYVFFGANGINCIDLKEDKIKKTIFIAEKKDFINLKGEQESFSTGNGSYQNVAIGKDILYVVHEERVLGFNIEELINNFSVNPNYIPKVVVEYGKKGISYVTLDYSNDVIDEIEGLKVDTKKIRNKDTTLLGYYKFIYPNTNNWTKNNRIVATSKFVFIQNPRGYGIFTPITLYYESFDRTVSLFDAETKKMIKEITSFGSFGGINSHNVYILAAYELNEYTMLVLDYDSPYQKKSMALSIYKNSDIMDTEKKSLKSFQHIEIPNLNYKNSRRSDNLTIDISTRKAYILYDVNDSITNFVVYDILY